MERSFALVLTFVSLVTTTPHGYGTKGGASAKAEARAVAGAIGDLGPIPLSIPSGAGYSGSFSKSSSSSFASSSASASSSSYSFSGSGVNSIGTGKGCQSGTCPETGTTGPSSNGLPHFGGANAFAAADAKAVSGSYSPCQGSNCSDRKCTSGQCSSDHDHTEKKNGCSSGTCQSESDKETSPSDIRSGSNCSSGQCDKDKHEGDDDSNDYAVNFNRNPQVKPSHGLSGQYSNKGAAYNSSPSCSNGKCSSTVSHHSHEGNNQNQQSPPATYLTTPNEHPPCTTPNCNQHSHGNGPETGGLPSSYNVPIQSATNPPNTQYSSGSSFEPVSNSYPVEESQKTNGAPCTSPGCSSYNSGTSIRPNYNIGQQEPSSKGLCVSGQCGDGATSGVISPIHGNSQSQIPSGLPVQPCNTPNCAEILPGHTNFGFAPGHKSTIPTYSNFPSYQPDRTCGGTSCSSATYSGSPTKPVESDAPTYTGGFGGPAGFLDTAPVSTKPPGHAGNYYGSSYTPGSSGSTGAFGSTPQDGSYGITKPNESPASHYVPTHTPGSYHGSETGPYGSAPTHSSYGTTKPNQYSTSGPSGSYGFTPTHGYFGMNKPHDYNSDGITQTSSNGGATISGYTKTASLLSTPGTHPHSLGDLSASTEYPFVPLRSSTTYPENNGIHKTSTADQNTAYNDDNYGSAGSSNTNTGYNSIPGSYGTSKPNVTPSAQSNPTYTGGFGGPTGTTDKTSSTKLTSGVGSCGPAGCNGQHNDNGGTTSHGATKAGTEDSSENKPAYNGGFGGPTGFLKPNDFSLPTNTPDSQSEHTPCTNGNCGPKNNHSVNQGHGNSLSGAHSLSSATANANAVAYSGGFGGPPGVLKPYDDGKVNNPVQGNQGSEYNPSNAGHSGSSINGKNSTPGSTGNGNGAQIGAHASASASANAGTYNGGNYQSNNGGSGGCNNGCGSTGDGVNNGFPDGLVKNGIRAGSVASAKSIAGANSFGFGSSFASSSASAHASAGAKGGYGKK